MHLLKKDKNPLLLCFMMKLHNQQCHYGTVISVAAIVRLLILKFFSVFNHFCSNAERAEETKKYFFFFFFKCQPPLDNSTMNLLSGTIPKRTAIIDLVGLLHDVGEVEGPLRFLWVNGVRGLSPGRHAAQSPAQGAAKFRRRRFLRRTKNTHTGVA